MYTYFISGHRDIAHKEFQQHYAKHIMNAVMKDPKCRFVVGDYYGVDEMAQEYLASLKNKYPEIDVVVYHMFEGPRNNKGDFPTKGGYQDDHSRDSAMTLESDEDIAWVRSGKQDSGTAQNILRRRVKELTHGMSFDNANDFLQGLLNVVTTHPENEYQEPPVVYYP